jgi:hypothetical protein
MERKDEVKRIPVLTVMIAGLLFSAGALLAIPPDRGEYTPTFDYILGDCGDDFFICEAGEGVFRWKEFFFNNGDLKKYQEKGKVYGMIYECGNADNFLPYNPLSYTYIYHYVSGEEVFHGLYAMITVPGYGQIFKDVGTIVFDWPEIVFEAGEHQWWNEDFNAVCDFLMNGD